MELGSESIVEPAVFSFEGSWQSRLKLDLKLVAGDAGGNGLGLLVVQFDVPGLFLHDLQSVVDDSCLSVLLCPLALRASLKVEDNVVAIGILSSTELDISLDDYKEEER